MSKLTQKNKRNLRISNKKSLRKSNKKSLRRSNKSLRRMKGGAEVSVGNETLDNFINGRRQEDGFNLDKFWAENFMDSGVVGETRGLYPVLYNPSLSSSSDPRLYNPPQLTKDGKRIAKRINDEENRLKREREALFASFIRKLGKSIDTSRRLDIIMDSGAVDTNEVIPPLGESHLEESGNRERAQEIKNFVDYLLVAAKGEDAVNNLPVRFGGDVDL